MEHGILSAIGRTPLVRLSRLFPDDLGVRVYAKLEMLNPGGSAKDRPALRILREAWRQGRIGPGSTVVESSSGNMAISLAGICAYMGMKLVCVVDPRTSAANVRILQAYGATIDLVDEPDAATGEFLPARLNRVRELIERTPNSFWPNQYANDNNYLSHRETTMAEILGELGHADYVIGGVSTCGTMLGCASYIREKRLGTRTVAVDAAGSVIFGGDKGPRRFPGLGAGIVPPFAERPFADRVIRVTDRQMVDGCRRLIRREAILAGPSSGGVIHAARLLAREPGMAGAVVAVILHDRGERYLDTVFADDWVERELGADALGAADDEPDRQTVGATLRDEPYAREIGSDSEEARECGS